MLTQQAVFDADAKRFDDAFRKAGAIQLDEDGFQWIDTTKVPSRLVDAYQSFIQYGYANGLMP